MNKIVDNHLCKVKNKQILGAIIGDIIGAPYEFYPAKECKDIETRKEQRYFTDDTICTVAFMDAIMNAKDDDPDYKGYLIKWCKKYPYPMGGYGGRFSEWLYFSEDHLPYDSFGNGSAMRVSPIVFAYLDSPREVLRQAIESAKITHSHPEGIRGALVTAYCTMCGTYRRLGMTKDKILKLQQQTIYEDWQGYNLDSKMNKYKTYRSNINESCQFTLPLVLKCYEKGESYMDVISKTIACGGDTDTNAAIAGSMAGTYYEIPQNIVDEALQIIDVDEIKEIIFQFDEYITEKNSMFTAKIS